MARPFPASFHVHGVASWPVDHSNAYSANAQQYLTAILVWMQTSAIGA